MLQIILLQGVYCLQKPNQRQIFSAKLSSFSDLTKTFKCPQKKEYELNQLNSSAFSVITTLTQVIAEATYCSAVDNTFHCFLHYQATKLDAVLNLLMVGYTERIELEKDEPLSILFCLIVVNVIVYNCHMISPHYSKL